MAHVVRECIRPEIVAHTAGIRSVSNMGVWLRGYRDGVESVEMTRGWLVAGIEERGCRRQNARREVAWLGRGRGDVAWAARRIVLPIAEASPDEWR